MNVSDNDLQGDTLSVIDTINMTLNLSNNAVVSNLVAGGGFGGSSVVANVDRNATLNATVGGRGGNLTVNLSDSHPSHLFGNFILGDRAGLRIFGGDQSSYINNGTNLVSGFAVIDDKVVGSGTFDVSASGVYTGASLEFGGFVSEEQTIGLSGGIGVGGWRLTAGVKVDDPKQFHATVDLHDLSLADLVGLANVNSWDYTNDMLSMFDTSGRVVDQLHVLSDASSAPHGLSVSKNSGDILITPGSDFHGSLLPTT